MARDILGDSQALPAQQDTTGNTVVVGPTPVQTDGLRPVVIEGLEGSTFRDEFPGAAVDTTKWTTVVNTGMTVAVTGSNLRLTTSTQSGNYAELVSIAQFRPPCRLYVNLAAISQRIANQEFSLEFVEVGSTQDAGNNRAGIFFDSATATQASFRVWSQGDVGSQLASQTITTSTAGASVFELDLTPEEVWFYQTPADNSGARSNSFRITRKVPDPTKLYVVRIRAKNTAVVTTTNLDVDAILVENYTHHVTEIARARGGATQGEQLPVQVVGTVPNVTIGTNVAWPAIATHLGIVGPDGRWQDESSANLAGAAAVITTARDCWAVAANTAPATGTLGSGRFRVTAAADQALLVHIEGSPDNATWFAAGVSVASTVTTNSNVTATNVAVADVPVNFRYYRARVVNTSGSTTTALRVVSSYIAFP